MRRATSVFAAAVILAWAATAAAQSATILGIIPLSPGTNSSEQILSISGGGFRPGLSVSLTTPAGGSVTVSGANILSVTGSSVQARVTLAVAGAWRVRVTNPGSKVSNEWRFTVRPGAAVNPPTANPGGGTYTAAQKVALTCATSGATIRCTTNGNEPTSASPVYTAPIAVPTTTTTLKSRAFKNGMADSAVTTASYAIILTPVAAPVATPGSGCYTSPPPVTLVTATPGATIRYTTNGTAPSSTSAIYTAPIRASNNTTIRAQAFKAGMTDSAVIR